MWRSKWEEEVVSFEALYVPTKSSGVMVAIAVRLTGHGAAKVLRRQVVSWNKLAVKEGGNLPSRKDFAKVVSPFLPTALARGPDPKGVKKAWLYWEALMLQMTWAISVGLVIVFQGPDYVLGSSGLPWEGWFGVLGSGISILFEPGGDDPRRRKPIFLCTWRICSRFIRRRRVFSVVVGGIYVKFVPIEVVALWIAMASANCSKWLCWCNLWSIWSCFKLE